MVRMIVVGGYAGVVATDNVRKKDDNERISKRTAVHVRWRPATEDESQ